MPRRILLIDSDPTLASEIEAAFVEQGLSIDHAADAGSGRFLVQEFDYAAILLEIRLPRQSGLDLLKDISERVASIPVVVVTAHLPGPLRDTLT